jgi:hypothetical protein
LGPESYYTGYCKHIWLIIANKKCKGKFSQYYQRMFKLTKSESQYDIRIYYKIHNFSHLACREIRKSELQAQFINIASSKTRQLIERLLYTDIFRAPPRAVRVVLQRKTSVTIILNAPFCKRCVSNNSALSSSALHSALRASLCSFE